MTLLDTINSPDDVSQIPREKLQDLSDELRAYLIETIGKSGGHFGSNLGVVELTTALHYVYNSPHDNIVWDVGHQAYAHKVLTGRKDELGTIRQQGGLAPFPKRSESEHDAFGVGHSSTSVSAAVGMALAHAEEDDAPRTVAVIGDGALGGGMVYEAFNHAGDKGADVLVILNDNKMSISPNVGAMNAYLTRLISSPAYNAVREKGKKILGRVPPVQEIVRRTEEYAKGMITPGTLFEELGFAYYGPIDGHDTAALTDVLENLQKTAGPRFLHVVTTKGKGLSAAEKDGLSMHAVKPNEIEMRGESGDPPKSHTVGIQASKGKTPSTYTEVFSAWICDKAAQDEKLIAVTPAMREGSGLVAFEQQFPARYHDVGIAEQHAVTFAAGLACEGKKPVVAIYSTFLQRAYDQLIHDVAIQKLDVLFAIDRAGAVGPDGATHGGAFDVAFMRTVPEMIIMTPSDYAETEMMLEWGYQYDGPAAVRYPRGHADSATHSQAGRQEIEMGKGRIVREGERVAILNFGPLLENARAVAEAENYTLVDMRFVKPLDGKLLTSLAATHERFVTIEDGAVMGGAGSAVNDYVLNENLDVRVKNLGLPDRYQEHGTREELLADAGLDTKGLAKSLDHL